MSISDRARDMVSDHIDILGQEAINAAELEEDADAHLFLAAAGALRRVLRVLHRAELGDPDDLRIQLNQLADCIMNDVDGEPSRNEGAVNTAIRLLRERDPMKQHIIDLEQTTVDLEDRCIALKQRIARLERYVEELEQKLAEPQVDVKRVVHGPRAFVCGEASDSDPYKMCLAELCDTPLGMACTEGHADPETVPRDQTLDD